MDDTDDKARRNLVVAAGVICMSALAGLPLEVVVDRILGLGHDTYQGLKVSPLRLWLCVSLVLAYLATRYRFAEETAAHIANAKQEWGVLLAQGCEREVRRSAKVEPNGCRFAGVRGPSVRGWNPIVRPSR